MGLRGKQAELADLMAKLGAMEDELRNNTRKKERLEAETELCAVKLERAEKLIGGLGGEKVSRLATATWESRSALHPQGLAAHGRCHRALCLQARWTDTAESLARAYVNLTGDMLVSAGIIAYAGAFTASYRSKIIEAFVDLCKGAGIAHTARFSLGAILGEPVKVRRVGRRDTGASRRRAIPAGHGRETPDG